MKKKPSKVAAKPCILVRLPKPLKDKLESVAGDRGETAASIVRGLIREMVFKEEWTS